MFNPTPIVIVAYNRAKSLQRLLNSLAIANYPNNNITLLISIDKAVDNQEVLEIAENFTWKHGDKIINYQEENLGLRKHILQCGDLSNKYGSVLILEDDLYVSPNFYNYTIAAIEHTANNDQIGGISLYNHQMNVHTKDNFNALDDGYDNWYFQFASSWGQAWTKSQWNQFMTWYKLNHGVIPKSLEVPANVTNWSDKSWLKYYIVYLIQTKKYFFYPKISLTTNFSDQGTHVASDSTAYQVPLDFSIKNSYTNFSSLANSHCIYDAFYENEELHNHLALNKNDVCIDLYGYKNKRNEKYWLTTRILNYEIVKSYGKSLKPIDANIIQNIKGVDIFLYDTHNIKNNDAKLNKTRKLIYNIKHISYQNALLIFISHLYNKIKKIL